MVGELINSTGFPQTEVVMTGTFFNARNEIIGGEIDTLSYIPIETIPAGAYVPFELIVESPEAVYRFDLSAISEAGDNPPRNDFQFLEVTQWHDDSNLYCLGGQIKNPDSALEDELLILAVIYNDRRQVVSFGEYSVSNPETVIAAQTASFELCIDPQGQNIPYHNLSALGR